MYCEIPLFAPEALAEFAKHATASTAQIHWHGQISFALRSGEVFEFLNDNLIFLLKRLLDEVENIQIHAHRLDSGEGLPM